MNKIIGKKSYWKLVAKLIILAICTVTLAVAFSKTNNQAVLLAFLWVFGTGGFFILVTIFNWIFVPKILIIADETKIFLVSQNTEIPISEIESIDDAGHRPVLGSDTLYIKLKNGKEYRQRHLENVSDLKKELRKLLKDE